MELPKNIKILDSWWFNSGNIQFHCIHKNIYKTIGVIKFSNGYQIKHYIGLCKGENFSEDVAFIYHFGSPFKIDTLGEKKYIKNEQN